VRGFLASPSIGKNAIKYLEELGFEWVQVDFT